MDDARGDAARHRKRWNIARGHGIGRQESAASDDNTFRDGRVGRHPRPLANVNRRKTAWAKPIGTIDLGVISSDQNSVRSELHLVLQDDPPSGMQPAARCDEDIAADSHSIGKVDSHTPCNLKISTATLERWPQQESTQPQNGPQIRQPASGNRDEMEPEILEHSQFPDPTPVEPPHYPQAHSDSVP
jgi:hypothetical protein